MASGSKLFNWEFQNPPKDLIAVYFKPQNNPFKLEHPYSSNYKYTLDDLLKHEIAIEEAYIFWDKTYNPKFIDLKPIYTRSVITNRFFIFKDTIFDNIFKLYENLAIF
ncbi:MAG: hypothetical protein ACN23H_01050 [Candidatus Phytoplasma vitis]|nr:MAG: hypothetical protein M6G77_00925 [Candidatus Phytoplasma vitis]